MLTTPCQARACCSWRARSLGVSDDNRGMVTTTRDKWMLRSGTFLVWAVAAACAMFWGLKMSAGPSGAAVAPVDVAGPVTADPAAIARLLGATSGPTAVAPAAAVASRFVLVGVLAGRQNGGAALIAVDGKPARPVRVGGAVEDGLVLQSLQGRKAVLGSERDGTVTLEMAPLASAAAAVPALPR